MEVKTKLLLVEDDANLGQILKDYLEIKGYNITLVRDGVEGLKMFNSQHFNLCLLDIMMPKKDGFELGEDIRKSSSKTPIIYLTAKSMKEDAIKGLKIGADDYITKPFSMEELLLRIKAILRRTQPEEEVIKDPATLGKFTYDPVLRTLTLGEKVTTLTTKENNLLIQLVTHKNKVLSRTEALIKVWGDDSYFNARSMDVYVTKLRKHLKADDKISIITAHGEGFKLVILQ